MKNGQDGLNRRNTNFFGDLLPSSYEDARHRRLTAKQLRLVKISDKYFDKEKENIEKSTKLENVQKTKRKHNLKLRRKSLIHNLRSKRLLRAEIEDESVRKWKKSFARITHVKNKGVALKQKELKTKKSRKDFRLKKIADNVVSAFEWQPESTDKKPSVSDSTSASARPESSVQSNIEVDSATSVTIENTVQEKVSEDGHLDSLFSKTVEYDKQLCYEGLVSKRLCIAQSTTPVCSSGPVSNFPLNKFEMQKNFDKQPILKHVKNKQNTAPTPQSKANSPLSQSIPVRSISFKEDFLLNYLTFVYQEFSKLGFNLEQFTKRDKVDTAIEFLNTSWRSLCKSTCCLTTRQFSLSMTKKQTEYSPQSSTLVIHVDRDLILDLVQVHELWSSNRSLFYNDHRLFVSCCLISEKPHTENSNSSEVSCIYFEEDIVEKTKLEILQKLQFNLNEPAIFIDPEKIAVVLIQGFIKNNEAPDSVLVWLETQKDEVDLDEDIVNKEERLLEVFLNSVVFVELLQSLIPGYSQIYIDFPLNEPQYEKLMEMTSTEITNVLVQTNPSNASETESLGNHISSAWLSDSAEKVSFNKETFEIPFKGTRNRTVSAENSEYIDFLEYWSNSMFSSVSLENTSIQYTRFQKLFLEVRALNKTLEDGLATALDVIRQQSLSRVAQCLKAQQQKLRIEVLPILELFSKATERVESLSIKIGEKPILKKQLTEEKRLQDLFKEKAETIVRACEENGLIDLLDTFFGVESLLEKTKEQLSQFLDSTQSRRVKFLETIDVEFKGYCALTKDTIYSLFPDQDSEIVINLLVKQISGKKLNDKLFEQLKRHEAHVETICSDIVGFKDLEQTFHSSFAKHTVALLKDCQEEVDQALLTLQEDTNNLLTQFKV